MSNQEYDDDHPDVILAKAEAKRLVLQGRSTMHPIAQAIYAFFDGMDGIVSTIGCFLLIILAALLICAPSVIPGLLGGK